LKSAVWSYPAFLDLSLKAEKDRVRLPPAYLLTDQCRERKCAYLSRPCCPETGFETEFYLPVEAVALFETGSPEFERARLLKAGWSAVRAVQSVLPAVEKAAL
jgi:hypothetical protein